jgi:hypothetical protein
MSKHLKHLRKKPIAGGPAAFAGLRGSSRSQVFQNASSTAIVTVPERVQAPETHREIQPAPMPVLSLAPENVAALSRELAIFNRRMEEVLSRDRSSGRGSDERKEMWVLLSALTVVVIFCFVAFYLNQAEVREMRGDIQADIDQAGLVTVAALEKRISGLRLEKVPELQTAMDRFLKEKDRRDGQRLGEILQEIQSLPGKGSEVLREDMKALDARIEDLRKTSDEIRRIQGELGFRGTPAAALADGAGGSIGPAGALILKNFQDNSGRAARAPNGPPANQPSVPMARPPGQDSKPADQ